MRAIRTRFVLLSVAALLVVACGGSPAPGPVIVLDPIHVKATRDEERIVVDAYDASGLFDRAARELRVGRCEEAIRIYRQLVTEFKESRLAAASLYNAGLCEEQLGRFEKAAASYEDLVASYPDSRDVNDALFRAGGAYERLLAWDKAAAAFDRLLALRKDLAGIDRVEALARKGSALLELGRRAEARLALEDAVTLYRSGRGISATAPVFHFAMAEFKLGEVLHDEMREVLLPAEEAAIEPALKHKCDLLLEAQAAYSKAIEAGHPHWAAAAAYRIGALYRDLWEDLLAAPVPPDLDAEAQDVYREVLRGRIRVLLRKAVAQWERTLKMAVRLGLDNEWVDRTTRDLDAIRELLRLDEASVTLPQKDGKETKP
ncbi:MAG: tetratricopeptide repeat protein [Deltaproteobacteria bacterium]|nr:tetratricopeptide repeat protein [Deltaproteobacteria bacterium]